MLVTKPQSHVERSRLHNRRCVRFLLILDIANGCLLTFSLTVGDSYSCENPQLLDRRALCIWSCSWLLEVIPFRELLSVSVLLVAVLAEVAEGKQRLNHSIKRLLKVCLLLFPNSNRKDTP